jgi:hypothetical protein
LSYNLMLNSGKKFRDKKINILILVLSEKKIRNETKNHNPPHPPFKLNGRSLILWWNDSLNNYGRYSKCSSAEKLINSIVYRYCKKHIRINNWFYCTDNIFGEAISPHHINNSRPGYFCTFIPRCHTIIGYYMNIQQCCLIVLVQVGT